MFEVELHLGGMDPSASAVELYADALPGGAPEKTRMSASGPLAGESGYVFSGRVPRTRSAEDYTPRVVPSHPDALELEVTRILWHH